MDCDALFLFSQAVAVRPDHNLEIAVVFYCFLSDFFSVACVLFGFVLVKFPRNRRKILQRLLPHSRCLALTMESLLNVGFSHILWITPIKPTMPSCAFHIHHLIFKQANKQTVGLIVIWLSQKFTFATKKFDFFPCTELFYMYI